MEFQEFNKALQQRVAKMTSTSSPLFTVNVDGETMWDAYLNSFPPGTNEIYRRRREFDCSCCRNFVKNFGNLVTIDDRYNLHTIWDFEVDDVTFQIVANAMRDLILNGKVVDSFITRDVNLGTAKNNDLSDGIVVTWNHFNITLPVVYKDRSSATLDTIKAERRDLSNALKRSLTDISKDATQTVIELIEQNSLYRGEESLEQLQKFLVLQEKYTRMGCDSFAWLESSRNSHALCKIRSSAIGTLLEDITSGTNLDGAVRSYEAKIAPENYKRPKPVFTEKMLVAAKNKVEELGFADSLARRFAIESDVAVNDVLWLNRSIAPRVKDDVFGKLASQAKTNPIKLESVKTMNIAEFMDILPTLTKIEAMFDPAMEKRLVSLIAPKNVESRSMFKWGNGFGWAYNGNMTDSSLKDAVKKAGGKVDGVLRFSISWENDPNDLDAHCEEPNGNHIYFGDKSGHGSSGELDVDIVAPGRAALAVENITWSDKSNMHIGEYQFYVHNFNDRGGKSGFSAEIEYDGVVYNFTHKRPLRQEERVDVATVQLSKNGIFNIVPKIEHSVSSKDAWGLTTGRFHDVKMVTYSPNFWHGEAVGNKHYMFIVNGCMNTNRPSVFFNEFLPESLTPHRKVFEALNQQMRVEDSDDQLSGFGFSSTQSGEITLRITGQQLYRVVKVTF